MSKRAKKGSPPVIPIWPATAPESDRLTHWWYAGNDEWLHRICDDRPWPQRRRIVRARKREGNCEECIGMYVDDLVLGIFRLSVTLTCPVKPGVARR